MTDNASKKSEILLSMLDNYFKIVQKLGDGQMKDSDIISLFLIMNDLFLSQPIPEKAIKLIISTSENYHKCLPQILLKENEEYNTIKKLEEELGEEKLLEYELAIESLQKLSAPSDDSDDNDNNISSDTNVNASNN